MKAENHEDFLAQDFKDNIELLPFPSRREFIKLLGGGIVIVVLGDFGVAQDASRERGARGSLPSDFNAFLRIGEDGRVTCFTGKIEMGQGTMTSLPQMLAEELEVPLDSVDIVMGDTALCHGTAEPLGHCPLVVLAPRFEPRLPKPEGCCWSWLLTPSKFLRHSCWPRME